MKILKVFICSFLILNITGCGSDNSTPIEKTAVVYVIANTANSKKVDMTAPLIQDSIYNSTLSYGYIAAVRVDSNPEVVFSEDLDIEEQFKNASKERLQADAKKRTNSIISTFNEITAKYSEADYLESIRIASSLLKSLGNEYTKKRIIVTGSGLSTFGYLQFQNNLLYASPEDIVESLKQRDALLDLENITVDFIGLGEIEEPQEKLTAKQTNNLKAIWKTICEASGGKCSINEYISVVSEETGTQLPPVTAIDIPKEDPIVYDVDLLSNNEAFKNPVILTENQIEFVADESNFLYPNKAVEILQPISDYLDQHNDISILIVGCTASYDDENNQSAVQLSQERAECVKNKICELSDNISEANIKTLGTGCDNPWHIKGLGYGKTASSNRKCVIINAKSNLAKQLLNNKSVF